MFTNLHCAKYSETGSVSSRDSLSTCGAEPMAHLIIHGGFSYDRGVKKAHFDHVMPVENAINQLASENKVNEDEVSETTVKNLEKTSQEMDEIFVSASNHSQNNENSAKKYKYEDTTDIMEVLSKDFDEIELPKLYTIVAKIIDWDPKNLEECVRTMCDKCDLVYLQFLNWKFKKINKVFLKKIQIAIVAGVN